MLKHPNLLAKIGVAQLLVDIEAPHLSAKIGVTPLLISGAAPC